MKVSVLPLTANGKIDRKKLLEMAVQISLHDDILPPRDRIEYELCNLWEATLKFRVRSVHDSFISAGGHSLLAILLVTKINRKFGTKFPVSWIFIQDTVAKQAKILRDGALTKDHSLILCFNEHGSNPPLFFVHPGGGGAEAYFGFAAFLDQEQPFYGIDSYNFNVPSSCIDSIEILAATYIKEMKAVNPVGPYYLGGWSFGGMVAFEMARQLAEMGEHVANLYLLDAKLFDYCDREMFGNIPWDSVFGLLAQHDPYYRSLPTDYQKRFIKAFEAENKAIFDYVGQGLIERAILFKATCFPSREDILLNEVDEYFEMWSHFFEKQDNGWGKQIQNLDVVAIATTHHRLLNEETAKIIADVIQKSINQDGVTQ